MPDFTNSLGKFAIVDTLSPAVANPPGASVTKANALVVNGEGLKATYRVGAVAQTLFSTSAAVILEIVGSATKTLRIKRISMWAQAATKFYAELTILRCTGISASGGATTPAPGKHDINDPAAAGTVNFYTAAATAGPGNAVMGAEILPTSPPTATLTNVGAILAFSQSFDKPLVLRGAGDVIEIFNNTTGLGAGTFGFEVEWEEDNS